MQRQITATVGAILALMAVTGPAVADEHPPSGWCQFDAGFRMTYTNLSFIEWQPPTSNLTEEQVDALVASVQTKVTASDRNDDEWVCIKTVGSIDRLSSESFVVVDNNQPTFEWRPPQWK